MELNFFHTKPLIKDILENGSFIFTGEELNTKVSLEESVNPDEDFMIGGCVISTIRFDLKNLNELINDLSGKEFIWKQAIETGKNEYPSIAKAARCSLLCLNGIYAYAVSDRSPYLSIWSMEPIVKIKDVSEAPAKPVKGLVIRDNKLYCLHDEAPWVTAYNVTENDLIQTEPPALNDFEIGKIIRMCKMRKSINIQGNLLKEYAVALLDLKPVNLKETTSEILLIGNYKAEKPVKQSETLIKVTSYDRMRLFDKNVDTWLSSIAYPITLKDYLKSLCAYVGITYQDTPFVNQDYIIQKSFEGENISGVQVLRWIAEAAACFGKINAEGKFYLTGYTAKDYSADGSDFKSVEVMDYTVPKIDKLQIRVAENDIGVIIGTGINAYIIQDNPLLYATSDTALRPVATNIYNAIKDITYIPYSVDIWPNPFIRAGDRITLQSSRQTFSAYIMNKRYTAGMDRYEATGNMQREIQSDATNFSIMQLKGKTNDLTRTLDSTISRISDAEGNISAVEQLVNSISFSINNTRVQINSSGVTIYEGGFRIVSGGSEILYFDPNEQTYAFEGSIIGSDISGSTIYFGSGKSGATLKGYGSDGAALICNNGIFNVSAKPNRNNYVPAYMKVDGNIILGTQDSWPGIDLGDADQSSGYLLAYGGSSSESGSYSIYARHGVRSKERIYSETYLEAAMGIRLNGESIRNWSDISNYISGSTSGLSTWFSFQSAADTSVNIIIDFSGGLAYRWAYGSYPNADDFQGWYYD